mgnify:CR=1 FL=1|tara:strand:+ start:298 stop:516 length:219 start_codon:yes stop_codon:yes gene_type:complete
MKELIRSNDIILINWLQVLLKHSGIEAVVFDSHMSVLEGSAGAIQRRLMVLDEQYKDACLLVEDAGEAELIV